MGRGCEPDRRTVLAGLTAAAVAQPTRAGAREARQGLAALSRAARYVPRWLELAQGVSDQDVAFRAQYAAFLGDEATALANAAAPLASDVALPASATAEDALTVIRRRAEGRRVVILNEAHTASRHRLFLAQVLRALAPLGFRRFAAEAFINMPPGAPGGVTTYRMGATLDATAGWYVLDPVFAEAVREASELGYGFSTYEARPDQRPTTSQDRLERIARRETVQAENLAAELAKHPEQRFLIYVGHSHLREAPDRDGSEWMARRLSRLTGIDPLTIEQSATGSFRPYDQRAQIADLVTDRFNPRRPVVVTADGEVFGAAALAADIAVFHPVLPHVAGRTGWLAADERRRRADVRVPSPSEPTLAQAQPVTEALNATPADQYWLEAGAQTATFFLRPGRYRIRLETAAEAVIVDEVAV